jgi:hypothetical protein
MVIRSATQHEDATEGFADVLRETETVRARVLAHPVYARVAEVESLRVFMSNHVFAVWDFMSVLKVLQRRLTCVEVPWLQPADTVAARFVNEIVLNEETDEVAPGRFVSHFELYLEAMREVGADGAPVRDLQAALRSGGTPEAALGKIDTLPSTKAFVLYSLSLARRSDHEVAAAFLLGREDLVPQMFERLLGHLSGRGLRADSLELYLRRHIQLDGEEHGPLARRLLERLCGRDPARWREAAAAAREAIQARLQLWDGVLAALSP